jgi:hypothetical protein
MIYLQNYFTAKIAENSKFLSTSPAMLRIQKVLVLIAILVLSNSKELLYILCTLCD